MKSWSIAVPLGLALLAPGLVFAKPSAEQLEQAYAVGYTQARFNKADANGDGLLTRAEAAAEALPVEKKALGKQRFAMADTNNDGVLTLQEAAAQTRRERRLYQFAKAHPKTFKRLVKQAAKHPKALRWLIGHPKAARRLAKLARRHPRAAKQVVRKLRSR